MSRVLTLDASMATCLAGVVEHGSVVLGAERVGGDLAALPSLVDSLFAEHGRELAMVAVIVGPGSFTGLRASIALAHGIGLAARVPVVGVTVGAALAPSSGPPFWAAIDSKRGRIFLERDGVVESWAIESVPAPSGPIVLGGDAALALGEVLSGKGADVQLGPAAAEPLGIAHAAQAGRTRPAQPIYVDPPAARPGPAGRPAPA